jgi:hypothetical protein
MIIIEESNSRVTTFYKQLKTTHENLHHCQPKPVIPETPHQNTVHLSRQPREDDEILDEDPRVKERAEAEERQRIANEQYELYRYQQECIAYEQWCEQVRRGTRPYNAFQAKKPTKRGGR